jgi:hypothetical protein
LKSFWWQRIESGALFDAPLGSRTYERLSAGRVFEIREIMREARLCAGHICGMFAKEKGIILPFLGQRRLISTASNNSKALLDSFLKQRKLTGSLTSNDFTLGSCFFGKEEVFNEPQVHEGLGLPAFVNVGHPLDDYTHIVTQRRLEDFFRRENQDDEFNRPPFISRFQWRVKKYFEEELLPQHELLEAFSDRVHKTRQLDKLEKQLRSLEGYFIFRCSFVESGVYPDICRAFCEELGVVVDVVLAPKSRVDIGDRVVCTEIVELNAQDELIVLGF